MKHKITSGLLAILGDLNFPIIPQYNRLTFNVGAYVLLKGTLSGLRQFFAAKSPLEMMKNTFYFTSKALFVLKIFKSFSWPFGQVAKQLDKKDKINFKFDDVTAWLTKREW